MSGDIPTGDEMLALMEGVSGILSPHHPVTQIAVLEGLIGDLIIAALPADRRERGLELVVAHIREWLDASDEERRRGLS